MPANPVAGLQKNLIERRATLHVEGLRYPAKCRFTMA